MVFQPTNISSQIVGPVVPTVAYCNGVQVAGSQWDFTLLFTHATPIGGPPSETGEVRVEQRIVQAVVMSPQHMKALLGVLQQHVTQWEDANGEIGLPAEFLAQFAAQTPTETAAEAE